MTEEAMPRTYFGREIARMKASDGINPAVATAIMVATAVAKISRNRWSTRWPTLSMICAARGRVCMAAA